jgi:hypothetical protein
MANGGCLCGKVRYTTDAPLRDVVYCHCDQCRRQTGLYYAATAVPWASLRITGGRALRWYASSDFAKRGFCRTCGSALFWKPAAQDHVAILAGSLDDPSGLKARCHIFTKDKGCFYRLEDGLPQFLRDTDDLPVNPD